jgi:hypothetical protein
MRRSIPGISRRHLLWSASAAGLAVPAMRTLAADVPAPQIAEAGLIGPIVGKRPIGNFQASRRGCRIILACSSYIIKC